MPGPPPPTQHAPDAQLDTPQSRTLLRHLNTLRTTMSARIEELSASVERLRAQAAELERALATDTAPAVDPPRHPLEDPQEVRRSRMVPAESQDMEATPRPPPAREMPPQQPLPAALTTPLARMPRSHDPGRWISEEEISLILDRASRGPVYLHVHASSRPSSRVPSAEPSPRPQTRDERPPAPGPPRRHGMSPTNTGQQRANTPVVVGSLEGGPENTATPDPPSPTAGGSDLAPPVSDRSERSTPPTTQRPQPPAISTRRGDAADDLPLFSSLIDSLAESTDHSDSALFSSSPLLEEVGVSGIPLHSPRDPDVIAVAGPGIPLDAHQPRHQRPAPAATPVARGERREHATNAGLTTRGRRVLARQREMEAESGPVDPSSAPWESVLSENRRYEPAPFRRTVAAVEMPARRNASSDLPPSTTVPAPHRAHVHARVTLARGVSRSQFEGLIPTIERELLDAVNGHELRIIASEVVRHRPRTTAVRISDAARDQVEDRSRTAGAPARTEAPRDEQAMRDRAGQRGWTEEAASVPGPQTIRNADVSRGRRDAALETSRQQPGQDQLGAQPASAEADLTTRLVSRLRLAATPFSATQNSVQGAMDAHPTQTAHAAMIEAQLREGEARTDRLLRESLDANARFRARIRELVRLRAELNMLRAGSPRSPAPATPTGPSSASAAQFTNAAAAPAMGSDLAGGSTSMLRSAAGHENVEGGPRVAIAREEVVRRSSIETVRGDHSSEQVMIRPTSASDEVDVGGSGTVSPVDGSADELESGKAGDESPSEEEVEIPFPGSVGTCGPVDENVRLDAHLWPAQMFGTRAVDPPYVSMLDLAL